MLFLKVIFFTQIYSIIARKALLIIDIQNCFLTGGSLAVDNSSELVHFINLLRKNYSTYFDVIALTQDFHCPNHISFASQHNKSEYDMIDLFYSSEGNLCKEDNVTDKWSGIVCEADDRIIIQQQLWPDHCISGTYDASFPPHLERSINDIIVTKGTNCEIDSYSAFYDNGGFHLTDLHNKLLAKKITHLYLTGIATDYCVCFTALDAIKLGYNVTLILDGIKSVTESTGERAILKMKDAGVEVIYSHQISLHIEEFEIPIFLHYFPYLLVTLIFIHILKKIL